MAQHSGFFNAFLVDGAYDRTYNADDYCDNMAAIISDGVRRSGDNDLAPTSSGLTVTVAAGRAWIKGHWFVNDTAKDFTITPPTGTLSRVDGIYLRLNTGTATRSIVLTKHEGTPSEDPTAPDPVRSGNIYELLLATVSVAPNAENVTVTDMRADKTVCGWITTPIGYEDYWAGYDSIFESWFDAMKGQLSEDAAGNLQNQISEQNAIISKYVPVTLYEWSQDTDSGQEANGYITLSDSLLNFDRIVIEYTQKSTYLLTHEPAPYNHMVSLYMPQAFDGDINFELAFPTFSGELTPQGSRTLIHYFAQCKIDEDYDDRIYRTGDYPVPSSVTSDYAVRIIRVLGYGNRNAPPIAPYNEVQTDTVTDSVEEVTTP